MTPQMPVSLLRFLFLPLLAMACACSAEDTVYERTQSRPNILILMAEDLGPRVGAFGDRVAITPNLDELARIGVRYPNTFTTAGVCAPSRAAHITGMHQISMGGQHMRASSHKGSAYLAVPPAEVKAYPELLRLGGYYTFTNHKLDYQFSEYAAGTGPFTVWDREGAGADWTQREAGQPFFGLINLPQTHESQLFDQNFESDAPGDDGTVVSPMNVEVPPYYPDTPVVREYIARQYSNVHEMDRHVGEVLAQLRADGLADSTIVIWTTDHGDGLPRAKREIYDSGIKVPMIIHWPLGYSGDSPEPGSTDERLVSFVDIGPTVLALAGQPIPEYMHGWPAVFDNNRERTYVYASKDRLDEQLFRERSVRDSQFKYIRNLAAGEPGGKHIAYRDQLGIMQELWRFLDEGKLTQEQSFWFEPRPAEELYDIVADPHEVNNLAADPAYARTLARLSEVLDQWLQRVGDLSDQPEQVMANEFWPGGLQPVTPAPTLRLLDNNTFEIGGGILGVSLGCRLDAGPWRPCLAGQRFELASGETLSVKAVRYGWQESTETRASAE